MEDIMNTASMTLPEIAMEFAEKFEYVCEQDGTMQEMVGIIHYENPELSREQATYIAINAWFENRDDTPTKADLLELKLALEEAYPSGSQQHE